MRTKGVAIGVAVASSTHARSDLVGGAVRPIAAGKDVPATPLLARPGVPLRVRTGYVETVRETLSDRDWAIIREVARVRLATSRQLERLCFASLAEPSRSVVRRRCLGRLVRARVLATLERRIGGVRAGSSGLVYGLDIAGKRLMTAEGRAIGPGSPGERFVRHTLAVTELYVNLSERASATAARLEQFEAEPASWWPDGAGGRLKPDAHVVMSDEACADHWWIEVDLATEHLTTLARKLAVYGDFAKRSQAGPEGIMPWVLVSVPDDKRYSDVARLIHRLPEQEQELFSVAVHDDAAEAVMRRLEES